MDVIHSSKILEAIMPPFSYFDVVTSKSDCLELFIYSCMWMILDKMIQMYVPISDKLARELEEAGTDERKRKIVMLKFGEYKLNIRNFFNGVFCVSCSTYYLFAYGLNTQLVQSRWHIL